MNSLFALLGIESWKPIVAALVLPPVPFLIAILVGARLLLPRRGLGWSIIVLSVAGLWFSATTGAGRVLEQLLLPVPRALSADRIAELRSRSDKGTIAIVALGGGVERFAPEYGVSNLSDASLERLRYALWLSRESGVPVAFTGGTGWAQTDSAPEAEVAARIAAEDFGRPLRWTEARSADTRQNATHTMPLLKRAGIKHIVLVTHGWHMPRALRAFREAASAAGITVEPAPMGLAQRTVRLEWLPSARGYERVGHVLREALGRLAGA